MRSVKEWVDFFENIFNDDSLCFITLAALISEHELDGNKKNQETALQISKILLENFDRLKFKSDERKKFVKSYLEDIPKIIKQYEK